MKIWFIATRIAGNDGVSLEAARWRDILTRMGHKVTFVAGELDRSGILIPELRFNWPDVVELHDKVLYGRNNYRKVESDIFTIAGKIEGKIRGVMNGRPPDLLIVANVFSLPMHFPLAVALARVIEEYKIPSVARHHDFWWERKRFLKSSMFPFFARWFPPNLPQIKHVVINSIAKAELTKRTGIAADIISDCFDFGSKFNKSDSYSKKWREDFGIKNDDTVFLQATRIVPRKRIEFSIKLVKKLKNPKAILVIAGHSGDEGHDYELKLRELIKKEKVRAIFVGDFVNSKRRIKTFYHKRGEPIRSRVYTLWDCFINSDYVVYPTEKEGFGNQFIEAVYFKKPIILTPYEVYKKDIEPLGFDVIKFGEKIRQVDVERNFELGKKHFSFEAIEGKIKRLL